MASKTMYGTYTYNGTPRGDIGTATYAPTAITVHPGVRTTYTNAGGSPFIGSDPKPLYFKNGAGLNRAAVASISWSSGVAVCNWLVYEADADNTTPFKWNNPVAGPVVLTNGTLTVTNPYALKTKEVSSGVVDIYCIDYDGRLVFRVRSSGLNGDTYTPQSTFYQFPALTPAGNDTFGVDLEIIGDNVYALFNSGTNLSSGAPSANYLNSTVVKLNLALNTVVAVNGPYGSSTSGGAAKNSFSIQAYNDGTNDHLIVTAVGGPQLDQAYPPNYPFNWNPGSRIQGVDPGTLAVTDLLVAAPDDTDPDNATDRYDFRALTFSADGNQAYILAGKFTSGFGSFSYRLYYTDMSTILGASGALVSAIGATLVENTTAGGYLWGLMYSESTVQTWFVKGEDLCIYDGTIPGQVASAGGIAALTTFTGVSDFPGLNFVTLYEDEVAAPRALKGYVAPAFASVSPAALLEREKFFKQVAAAKAKP